MNQKVKTPREIATSKTVSSLWKRAKAKNKNVIDVRVDGRILAAHVLARRGSAGTFKWYGADNLVCPNESGYDGQTGLRLRIAGTGGGGTYNFSMDGLATIDSQTFEILEPLTASQLAHDKAVDAYQALSAGHGSFHGVSNEQLGQTLRLAFSDEQLAAMVSSKNSQAAE